jgi:CspA family cold shock protein
MTHIIVSPITMSIASSSVTSAPVRLTGRVKWFNNKTGFGFISVVGGNDQYKDASEVFVHHSAVMVSQEQYRYLVEGEYVEFSVVNTEVGDHKFQASDVRGVKGGKLFCETRHEHRATQLGAGGERGSSHVRERGGRVDGGGRGGRVDRGGRGGGRVDRGGREGSEWMLVRRDRVESSDSREHRGYGRARRDEYSERPNRSEKHSSQSRSPDSAKGPSSTQVQTQVPAPVLVTQDVDSIGDVPATPHAGSKKAPRQSKPSA